MKIETNEIPLNEQEVDALIMGVYEKTKPEADVVEIDGHFDGKLTERLKKAKFNGEEGEVFVCTSWDDLPAKQVILVGLGKQEDFCLESLRRAASTGIKFARSLNARTVATRIFNYAIPAKDTKQKAEAIVEGAILGLYKFESLKKKKEEHKVNHLILATEGEQETKEVTKAIKIGEIVSKSVNYVRNLVNSPGNIVTPEEIAKEAKSLAKLSNVKVKVVAKKDFKRNKLFALESVARGSSRDAFFIVIEYNKGKGQNLALVGKGITFDTGGYDLKPAPYMEGMQGDMGGAGAVLGTIRAIAQLRLPIHVYGVISTCENMISGEAYRPFDIIQSHKGKTIEVGNTDAEGRLILADALSYSENVLKARQIIDLATLTGACLVALGTEAIGMMGTDEHMMLSLERAGNETYERVWKLPMWKEYDALIKSDVADVRSTSKKPVAGTISAAKFLQQFVEKTPWVHLDLAPSWLQENNFYMPKGGTGIGVRLLVKYLSNLCK